MFIKTKGKEYRRDVSSLQRSCGRRNEGGCGYIHYMNTQWCSSSFSSPRQDCASCFLNMPMLICFNMNVESSFDGVSSVSNGLKMLQLMSFSYTLYHHNSSFVEYWLGLHSCIEGLPGSNLDGSYMLFGPVFSE